MDMALLAECGGFSVVGYKPGPPPGVKTERCVFFRQTPKRAKPLEVVLFIRPQPSRGFTKNSRLVHVTSG
jgi:hypothetical protein